jgi:ABC-type sugar transport system ATPase subunit
MGKTGCVKSTLLEAACGLRQVRNGRIMIQGNNVTRWKPAVRGMGHVPQDGALFATMNVRENLSFALDNRRVSKKEIRVTHSRREAERLGDIQFTLEDGALREWS